MTARCVFTCVFSPPFVTVHATGGLSNRSPTALSRTCQCPVLSAITAKPLKGVAPGSEGGSKCPKNKVCSHSLSRFSPHFGQTHASIVNSCAYRPFVDGTTTYPPSNPRQLWTGSETI